MSNLPQITSSTIATTPKAHPLSLYKSNNSDHGKSILFIGGVHGDEPEGVELANKLLQWLMQNNHNSWLLIPCLNVDGFKAGSRVNANGVDLNRNFPHNWSPTMKAPRYFPGKHPGSEIETKALIETITRYSPRLICHFHSWNPCIVFTSDKAPKEAEILSQVTGYPLQSDIGYSTPGSLGDWAWRELKIPVICVEEKEGVKLETIWSRFEPAFEEIFR